MISVDEKMNVRLNNKIVGRILLDESGYYYYQPSGKKALKGESFRTANEVIKSLKD